MNDQYQIFTHKDLDGAVSLLTFLWSFPKAQVTYREITNLELNIPKEFIKRTCNLPKIMIMDLALRPEMLPELDHEMITFIDHHKRSEKYIKEFKNAKIFHEEIGSNTFLVRKLYKEYAPDFTEEQKKLILYADDHDSGQKKFKKSYDLNILFWTQFKNEFCYFCNYYRDGFVEFDQMQMNIIARSKKEAVLRFKDTRMFGGKVIIEGEVKNVVAAMTESFNNIVIDMIMAKYNPDILFYINTKTERISMRQVISKNPIDLSNFAEKYCDGSGHMYAAGGKITPLFMEFTKKLKIL